MSERLTVLITNDDGINGIGLKILAQELSEVADVYVLAPDSNRSAVSNHFSLSGPVTIKKVESEINGTFYSCSGYPVDCVITALSSDLFGGVKFDAVFSGINNGANLGTDDIYSGTVSAARQAVLYNVPGIAMSLERLPGRDFDEDFIPLARFAAENIRELIALSKDGLLVSLNALALENSDHYSGVEGASLCIRDYCDRVHVIDAPDGNKYGFINGGDVKTYGEGRTDYAVTRENKIALSLLPAELQTVEFKGAEFKL